MKETTNIKTDFLRCFRRQLPKKALIPSVLISLCVAVLVWCAFLFQGYARTDDLDRLVFFSTLYCFWIGLFNACQTLNGAVESGEWQYWVLGFRRSFSRYFSANFLSVLCVSLIQVFVFLSALFLLSSIAAGTHENTFLQVGFESTTNQLRGLLGCGWVFPKFLPVTVFLSLAFLVAVVCGVSLGILISVVARNTAMSQKAAVALVVLAMLSSVLVLDEQKDYEYVSEIACRHEKAEATPDDDDTERGNEKAEATPFSTNKDGPGKTILSYVSFAFPQRYFFNIANCARHKSVTDKVDLLVKEDKDTWGKLHLTLTEPVDESALPQIRARCVPAVAGVLLPRLLGEVLAAALWSLCVLAAAFAFLKFSEKYHELR